MLATIANPVELASQLTGREVASVTENGAPMGERHFVFYNPPVVNRQLGIRRGVVNVSGPAIFPLAVRMVWQVYEAVKLPIIGMGGVQSAQDVLELMLAGATAVEVGAANLVDPYACRDIVRALPQTMEQYHITNLTQIIGGAHHG